MLTPTSSQPVPPPSSDIAIGDYVQVSGTGGDGLRLHKEAGVSSEVRYIAIESEVFLVKDGPIDTDGYIWWLLQDPYTDNAGGLGSGELPGDRTKPIIDINMDLISAICTFGNFSI